MSEPTIERGQMWDPTGADGESFRVTGRVVNMEAAWYVQSEGGTSQILREDEIHSDFTLRGLAPLND